ncbi:MAG: type II toxin-antitoxin system RelE/ParE family toxin [Pseudomonadota bacterium]
MKRYRLTALARQDLIDIRTFTKAQWGTEQARHYLKGIERDYIRFAENPMLGRDYSHAMEGYRAWTSGSHVIYATVEGEILIIRRILHKNRDAPRHLQGE